MAQSAVLWFPVHIHCGILRKDKDMDTFWSLTEKGIVRTAKQTFLDTIEMAGNHIAAIVTYGVDEKGRLKLARELCYPQLRVRPRNTYGTLHAYHGENETGFLGGW